MSQLFETIAHLFHPRSSNNHRAKILHPDGFFALLVIAVVVSVGLHRITPYLNSKGAILGYSSTISIQTVIDETNAQRVKLGLPKVEYNETLSRAAQAKANDMLANQYWSHYSPSGKSPWEFMKEVDYTYNVAGENLARDFMQTDDMMRAWMNSPTHRENIINPRFHDIGIAVVNGKLNGSETTLVVQMFGTQLGSNIASSKVDGQAEKIEIEQVPVPRSSTDTIAQSDISNPSTTQSVLALSLEQITLPKESPLISPLYLSKAMFLAIIILIVSVLIYDFMIVSNQRTVRFVGKNFAHIALFLTVSFLIVFFKSGTIQ